MRSSISRITLLFFLASFSAAAATAPMSVRWQPRQLVNGAPVFFRVKSRVRLKTLTGAWLSQPLSFAYQPSTRSWYTLAGISLKTDPGTYPLHLTGETATGLAVSFDQKVRVRKGNYKVVVALSVPKQFTEPDPKQVEQIKHDKSTKEQVFQHGTDAQLWEGPFQPPVDAAISDVFGTRREFNGTVQSVHQGLDFRVPEGTPVHALNTGTVLLAQPLYFEGNCVFIDHGQGLLTIYLHLSKLTVQAGDHVVGGQQIGLSGATGRATGAHLHLAVRWRGEYLDPQTLLTLDLPGNVARSPSSSRH
jgi:murein DD-endopeptidase MepM/ murein hydrolase activator NlpD